MSETGKSWGHKAMEQHSVRFKTWIYLFQVCKAGTKQTQTPERQGIRMKGQQGWAHARARTGKGWIESAQ